MILAAGRGTRMQPHESTKPKPLVEIAEKPLIRYALDVLENADIKHTVINIHHLAEQIENYLKQQPFQITLSREIELLETGGGIVKAMPYLEDSFFTLNSDVICLEGQQPVLHRINEHWNEDKMDGLMLLCPLEKAIGYKGDGDFSLAEDGHIQPKQQGKPAYVYMGIQKLHKRFLKDSPEGAFSLSPLYRKEIAKGESSRLYGLIHEGNWLHVGDPEGVKLAEDYLDSCTRSSNQSGLLVTGLTG